MRLPSHFRPLSFVAAACVIGFGSLVPLSAELVVIQGPRPGNGGRYDSTIYHYDDATGEHRGTSYALNEGWEGACRGPDGFLRVVTNVLGATGLHTFDTKGYLVLSQRVPATSDGSAWISPGDLFFGPDGSLYGEGYFSRSSGSTYGISKVYGPGFSPGRIFVDTGSTTHRALTCSTFGPDGNLYAVSSAGIVRYNGQTGAAMGTFVALGTGGLAEPTAMIFGPDGALYVGSSATHSVLKFDGSTGAFVGTFIAAGSGGLNRPMDFAYGPDGRLYVASYGSNAVLRYDATTGAFIGTFLSGGFMHEPRQIVFTRASETDWMDDAPPAGASLGATGGDSLNWVGAGTYSPTAAPIFGDLAHVTTLAPGLHEHFFNFAEPLQLAAGDRLFAYVHIDKDNPPHEIMLSWMSEGSWEHRAFWGFNLINAGVTGTESRFQVSSMNLDSNELANRWCRLEVPAAALGLEGKSVSGMSFSLYGGRVTWDRAGKASPPPPDPIVTEPPPDTVPVGLWFAGQLPSGAWTGANGGDTWSWSTADLPYPGAVIHPSAVRAGLHEHYFVEASHAMNVGADGTLFAYVRLDPAAPPAEIMLSWFDGTWEHRAYWGANSIPYGTPGTAGRHFAGPLPTPGVWTRLQVPAASVGLAGSMVTGLSFSVFNGGVAWSGVGVSGGNPPPPPPARETVWFDDGFPTGARDGASGAGPWTWMANSPAPHSGANALYSTSASGPHEHYFNFAWDPLALAAGDSFFIYVYLDPASPPREIILSFCADNWEHRAYWGENLLSYATNGSPAQYRVGALPSPGQWVRLEVPASAIALEGKSVIGLSLTLSDGRAIFDRAGKLEP
jgi:hypothetical protein